MALITEVRFAHEDGALAGTLAAVPDLSASIVGERSTAPEQNVYFLRFVSATPMEVRSALEDDHTVSEFAPVEVVDDDRLWKLEFVPETKLLSPYVTAEGGFVLDAQSTATAQFQPGWRERWFFPDQDGIHEVWKRARDEGFEFEVLELSRQLRSAVAGVGTDPLTEQQRVALVTAYEEGYFGEPRETSLEELAETLEISPSAVNGRLRRGLKALIEAALVLDDGEVLLQRQNVEAQIRR
ncbi:helix-turn-helix domain-containing protein [Natrarchaeobaculum aegyptiacum]|uniref:Bacterio-opsin activator n=1 Tax=Natrarchaeobaculum aegyptiacum TaxID=745377 RepID=A0A2Z2HZ62_9EURY|nr:helix-turn-helix domain-containing protein [Natrarchaeobaculum aegyptiacum]ARS91207.1 bacterio-opsin activator [Natrarchaeobaculum aegyptiacum]